MPVAFRFAFRRMPLFFAGWLPPPFHADISRDAIDCFSLRHDDTCFCRAMLSTFIFFDILLVYFDFLHADNFRFCHF